MPSPSTGIPCAGTGVIVKYGAGVPWSHLTLPPIRLRLTATKGVIVKYGEGEGRDVWLSTALPPVARRIPPPSPWIPAGAASAKDVIVKFDACAPAFSRRTRAEVLALYGYPARRDGRHRQVGAGAWGLCYRLHAVPLRRLLPISF
ncbi:hypothetical protein EWM64_g9765 [Hericium alpestre]|uniref:Uncharacterized protein n=1 Tax=Hericium alpestre TaxID=135208 RepID=A0A4Y9ZJN5_9AGAM|nr:hypothetical protein EWM64_g9765 [Hericium alpestre]